jgi:hypothetical protein
MTPSLISTLYISLEHTDQCSQSVPRRLLVMAPTLASPLFPGSNPVCTAAPFQLPIFLTDSRTELTHFKVKVKVTLRLTVSQSVSLRVKPHLGPMTRYLLLFDSYVLVFVGRPL